MICSTWDFIYHRKYNIHNTENHWMKEVVKPDWNSGHEQVYDYIYHVQSMRFYVNCCHVCWAYKTTKDISNSGFTLHLITIFEIILLQCFIQQSTLFRRFRKREYTLHCRFVNRFQDRHEGRTCFTVSHMCSFNRFRIDHVILCTVI